MAVQSPKDDQVELFPAALEKSSRIIHNDGNAARRIRFLRMPGFSKLDQCRIDFDDHHSLRAVAQRGGGVIPRSPAKDQNRLDGPLGQLIGQIVVVAISGPVRLGNFFHGLRRKIEHGLEAVVVDVNAVDHLPAGNHGG